MYILTIATTNSEKQTSSTVFTFNTKDEVMERYHSELSYGYNQHLPFILCYIIDDNAKLIKSETYKYIAPPAQIQIQEESNE